MSGFTSSIFEALSSSAAPHLAGMSSSALHQHGDGLQNMANQAQMDGQPFQRLANQATLAHQIAAGRPAGRPAHEPSRLHHVSPRITALSQAPRSGPDMINPGPAGAGVASEFK